MGIKAWLLNKLGTPMIPVLKQIVLVLSVATAKIEKVLESLKELGVQLDGTVLNTIENITSAITVVRAAVIKILGFLGETVEVEVQSGAYANVDLDSEIDKLKSMI